MTTMIPTTTGTQTAAGWKLLAFWTWGAAEWIVLAGATIAIASLARVIVHIIQLLRTPVRGRKRPPAADPREARERRRRRCARATLSIKGLRDRVSKAPQVLGPIACLDGCSILVQVDKGDILSELNNHDPGEPAPWLIDEACSSGTELVLDVLYESTR